jgi:sugar/nucleoside kinase (ribokinase family)
MENALLDRLDCLVVNRIEAEMLSGGPVRDWAGAASALSKIGGRIKNVIVTLGGEGLVIKSADSTISPIAAKRVKVVSSHGAGDCFVGALAAKVAAGASLTEAETPQPRRMSLSKGEAPQRPDCRLNDFSPGRQERRDRALL